MNISTHQIIQVAVKQLFCLFFFLTKKKNQKVEYVILCTCTLISLELQFKVKLHLETFIIFVMLYV